MSDDLHSQCQRLYDAKAAQMILYGRALGLGHAEAEDVLHETFLAVMKLKEAPSRLEHYSLRASRTPSLTSPPDLSPNAAAARYRFGLQKPRHGLNGEVYENDGRTGERTPRLGATPALARAAQ